MKICFDVFLWPCIVLRETDMRPRIIPPPDTRDVLMSELDSVKSVLLFFDDSLRVVVGDHRVHKNTKMHRRGVERLAPRRESSSL